MADVVTSQICSNLTNENTVDSQLGLRATVMVEESELLQPKLKSKYKVLEWHASLCYHLKSVNSQKVYP